MKAVVFSGGRGARLSNLLGRFNKHLLPLGQKTIIEIALKALRKGGIEELLILTNKGWEDVFHAVLLEKEKDSLPHIEIKASRSPDLPLAAVLYEAKDFINGEDFLLFLGDNLFIGNIEKSIQSLIHRNDSNAVVLSRASDPCRFGVPIFSQAGIELIIEKPLSASTSWVVSGLARYKADVFQIIESLIKGETSRCDLTEVHNILISQRKLAFSYWRNFWFDIGTPSAYLQAMSALGVCSSFPKCIFNNFPFGAVFKEINFYEKISMLGKELHSAGR